MKAVRTERNSVEMEQRMQKLERADMGHRGKGRDAPEASNYPANSLRTGNILYLPHLIIWQQSKD